MSISDKTAEDWAQWLLDNAAEFGRLRAARVHAEEYRKSIKAIAMSQWNDRPLGVQEREAYASKEYTTHLTQLRAAVQDEETMRGRRVAAETFIDLYRTQEANKRGRF